MDTLDPAGEFLRIAERYRQMSDGELLVLMPQSADLTPVAQEALANEVRQRGLKAEIEEEEPSASSRVEKSQARASQVKAAQAKIAPPAFFGQESTGLPDAAGSDLPDDDSADDSDSSSSYDEDRKLVELCTVWSVRDALQVQQILDGAGIPFFMGPEKATGVDGVTSDFAKGVSVQIMKIGMPWAGPPMSHYEPEDDPTPKETEEPGELTVHCPICHSTEVVFEGGTSTQIVTSDDSSQKYRWSCDACGHQWEDDGVAKEE